MSKINFLNDVESKSSFEIAVKNACMQDIDYGEKGSFKRIFYIILRISSFFVSSFMGWLILSV